ncbi:MAG: peptidyl-prolyl cis-trans isomerase [Mesonia hippocampi]|uniref:peptidyl-prolyl cis-trans isomerase n=1 Tax=Mesonia hippocampi TaxID=1628250 RepID=UPI003F9AAC88
MLARVNNAYLYKKDIKLVLPETYTKEDSILLVNNYINNWATNQLLTDQAKINLPQSQLKKFTKLIEDYKKQLYTEAYKDVLISKQLDTLVTTQEIEAYYENNKQNFKLNQDLIKLRYIYFANSNIHQEKLEKAFKNYKEEDVAYLKHESLKYISYSLDDSLWISKKTIAEKIPPLSSKTIDEKLKKDKYLQLEDSLGVFLIKINDIRRVNETAPLTYVVPTVKQIILNKRKLEFSKKLEKEIREDALKNKKFEIY